jgi:hypothetical protein
MHRPATNSPRTSVLLAGCFAALALCILIAGTPALASRSTGITILDDKFQVVHVLNGRKSVAAFNAHWSNKQKVTAAKIVPHWLYKIDLKDGTRWLYDPAGYTQIVSPKPQTLYRIRSVGRFNGLIGIHRQPNK